MTATKSMTLRATRSRQGAPPPRRGYNERKPRTIGPPSHSTTAAAANTIPAPCKRTDAPITRQMLVTIRQQMAADSQALAAERSWDAAADRTLDLYRSIMGDDFV